MKLTFGSKVLVSALLFENCAAHKVLCFGIAKNVQLVICNCILLEVESTLTRIFGYTEEELQVVREFIMRAFAIAPCKITLSVFDDELDNKILSCALEAEADYLIATDHHLLELGAYKNTGILHPESFLRMC